MKIMHILASVATAAALAFSLPAQALHLTPVDATYDGFDLSPQNPTSAAGEKGYVETLFNTSGLSLYYKSNVGGGESGSFADAYDTSYPNSDPEDALISHVFGKAAIACPECYLAVKDGKHSPSYYFFDLSKWNGTESLELTGFWPAGGAISHVSIWGKPGDTTRVPEPGTMALLTLGLAGLLTSRRRRI